MDHKHIQHLYWRIGFGILPTELEKLSKKSKEDVVENLFQASIYCFPLPCPHQTMYKKVDV